MTKTIYSLAFATLLFVSLSACTTTTRMVSREVSVSPAIQIEEAKVAISKKDYTLAAKLLEPLAEQGRADAQYALGYLYFNGMGVPKSKRVAARWFKVAADSGNKNAKLALTHLPSPENTVIDLRDKNKASSETMPSSSDEPGSSENGDSKSLDSSEIDKVVAAAMEIPAADHTENDSENEQKIIVEQPEPDDKKITESLSSESHFTESLSKDEQWIIDQPDTHYTIQLIVLDNEDSLLRYMGDNNLQDNTVFYRTQKNGNTTYSLIHGSFESYDLAKESMNNLSSELKAAKPWIRNIVNIQKVLLSR